MSWFDTVFAQVLTRAVSRRAAPAAMNRKFRPLWQWCLVLALMVNTVVPVWASAAMDAALLRHGGQSAVASADHAAPAVPVAGVECDTDSLAPGAGNPAGHEDCDCDSNGTCTCPCTVSIKLIDIRVAFAARYLLSAAPVRALRESADIGLRTSVFRPPIA